MGLGVGWVVGGVKDGVRGLGWGGVGVVGVGGGGGARVGWVGLGGEVGLGQWGLGTEILGICLIYWLIHYG